MMFVKQTHSLVAVIRLLSNLDNRCSTLLGNLTCILLISGLVSVENDSTYMCLPTVSLSPLRST
jgi:hypothetical protein